MSCYIFNCKQLTKGDAMALWGGRFAQDAEKCVRDFTQSISYDKRLYKHDIEGSKAHALMLGASGIIPQASAEAICAKLDEISSGETMRNSGIRHFTCAFGAPVSRRYPEKCPKSPAGRW